MFYILLNAIVRQLPAGLLFTRCMLRSGFHLQAASFASLPCMCVQLLRPSVIQVVGASFARSPSCQRLVVTVMWPSNWLLDLQRRRSPMRCVGWARPRPVCLCAHRLRCDRPTRGTRDACGSAPPSHVGLNGRRAGLQGAAETSVWCAGLAGGEGLTCD